MRWGEARALCGPRGVVFEAEKEAPLAFSTAGLRTGTGGGASVTKKHLNVPENNFIQKARVVVAEVGAQEKV